METTDSHSLPEIGFNYHAPAWWGNRWIIYIESAAFAFLAATYLYIRHNFGAWPPPPTPPPDLHISSINLLLISISAAPLWYAARLARAQARTIVVGGLLALGALCGIAAIFLRGLEFSALHVRYNANAYGSITWAILFIHLGHLLAGTLETILIALVMFVGPIEKRHYADASAVAAYWYFIVLSWLAMYPIVFLLPRWR